MTPRVLRLGVFKPLIVLVLGFGFRILIGIGRRFVIFHHIYYVFKALKRIASRTSLRRGANFDQFDQVD